MSTLAFGAEVVRALWLERRGGPERVRRVREARLEALVRSAKQNTALWRERLAHIDPSLPINLAQIQPITKRELMSRFDDSVAGGPISRSEVEAFVHDAARAGQRFRDRFVVATTSGTTGEVGYFLNDARTFARMNGALLARVLRFRLVPREVLRFCFGRRYRMAMTIATEGHFITKLVAGFRPLAARGIVDVRPFSILSRIEETIHGLNRFRPHYIHGYATFVEALAHERTAGRLAIDPEFVSLGSEPVTASGREAIARAFPRAQIVETYGATECLAIANQCAAGRLHVNEDLAILEPVDASGRPVPVGQRSDKVYLTNLVNHVQPLLRYEISDSVTIMPDGCPCGSPMTSIRIDGRADETISLLDADGRVTSHPPIMVEAGVFMGLVGLRQYQLVHEAQNRLLVRVVPMAGADPSAVAAGVERALAAYLERAGQGLVGAVSRRVEIVDAIERTRAGHKLRQIYSQVPRLA